MTTETDIQELRRELITLEYKKENFGTARNVEREVSRRVDIDIREVWEFIDRINTRINEIDARMSEA